MIQDVHQLILLGKSIASSSEISEVEIRFDSKIISEESIQRITNFLGKDGWETFKYTEERFKPYRSYGSHIYRKINNHTICKSEIKRIKDSDGWYSTVLSIEKSIQYDLNSESYEKILAHKERKSKIFSDMGIRIDITKILDKNSSRTFFVEIEMISLTPSFEEQFVKNIVQNLQGYDLYIPYSTFFPIINYMDIIKQSKIYGIVKPNLPITLTKSSLKKIIINSKTYMMSPKMDGIRKFLLFISNYVIVTCPAINIIENVLPGSMKNICLVDCEQIGKMYVMFDILIYNGKDVKHCLLEKRLNFLNSLKFESIFEVKTYSRISDLPSKNYKTMAKCDGIIFTSTDCYSKKIYKWKSYGTTIDLMYNHENPISLLPISDVKHIIKNDGVYEFLPINNILVPIRYRPDRQVGNSSHVISRNLKLSINDEFLDYTFILDIWKNLCYTLMESMVPKSHTKFFDIVNTKHLTNFSKYIIGSYDISKCEQNMFNKIKHILFAHGFSLRYHHNLPKNRIFNPIINLTISNIFVFEFRQIVQRLLYDPNLPVPDTFLFPNVKRKSWCQFKFGSVSSPDNHSIVLDENNGYEPIFTSNREITKIIVNNRQIKNFKDILPKVVFRMGKNPF